MRASDYLLTLVVGVLVALLCAIIYVGWRELNLLLNRKRVMDQLEQDAMNWRNLLEVAGHWQDGSDEIVTLYQDDATRECLVKVGYESKFGRVPRHYPGATFAGALAAAIKGEL